jgi:hypothetical protein
MTLKDNMSNDEQYCYAGQGPVDVNVSRHEGYPPGWVRVVLMVSPDGKEILAIGGDREPGEGDTNYIGLARMRANARLTAPETAQEPVRWICPEHGVVECIGWLVTVPHPPERR